MIEYPWLFAIGIWILLGNGLGLNIEQPAWKYLPKEQKIARVVGAACAVATGIIMVAISFR